MSGVLRTVGKVAGIIATVAIVTGNPQIAAIATAVATPAAPGVELRHKDQTRMTAINIFADDRRAYIATDGAAFNCDTGAIHALGTKTMMLPALNMAIAFSGRLGANEFQPILDAEVATKTQSAILEALPAAAAEARYQLSVDWPDEERPGINQVRLWIAAYDRQRARPAVYSLFADAMEGEAAADAYKVREIAGHMTPALAPEALQAALPHGSVTEPRSDVVRLLRAQRRVKFDHIGGNGFGIGGECEFYTVDRRGVTVERVLRFADAVGCIPDPTDPGEPMVQAYRFPCDGSPAVQMA